MGQVDHLTSNSSSTIQSFGKIHLSLMQIIPKQSLQNFALVMTALLSCHVQKICSDLFVIDLITAKCNF